MAVILDLLKTANSKSKIVTIGFKRWGANLTGSHAISGFHSLEDAAMTTPATAWSDSAATADAALARLDDVLAPISDRGLHLATPGGWTVAQVIAHVTVSTLVWLGDMERLRQDPKLHSRHALPREA
jgi:DinB family protein